MMFAIINTEDLKELNSLVSLQDQVRAVRLQDKLGKQNFHQDMKKFLNQLLNYLNKLLKISRKL